MTRPKTRRELLRGLGSVAAIGALAGGGALLACKGASQKCDRPTPCGSCSMRGQCDKPEAKDALNRQEK
ncbi:MAG: hypothetical protein HN350_01385 [Phycisphaerales bacterium]|jgi:hypothetical protein|nr:hypothetical protein [Phycisphaerales bacterium]